MTAAFWELERRAESEQVPKYFFPFAFMRWARLPVVLEPPEEVAVVVEILVVVVVVGAFDDEPGKHWE